MLTACELSTLALLASALLGLVVGAAVGAVLAESIGQRTARR